MNREEIIEHCGDLCDNLIETIKEYANKHNIPFPAAVISCLYSARFILDKDEIIEKCGDLCDKLIEAIKEYASKHDIPFPAAVISCLYSRFILAKGSEQLGQREIASDAINKIDEISGWLMHGIEQEIREQNIP